MLLLFNHSFSQKINGKYKYAPKTNSKNGAFEIEILNDTVYEIKHYCKTLDCGFNNSNKTEKRGKIKRQGKFYYLIAYDSIGKRYTESPVKITGTKMIFYGYDPKNLKKLVKGFELKRSQ